MWDVHSVSGYYVFYMWLAYLIILSNSNDQIPLTNITGEQTNISPYLNFHFLARGVC